MIPIKIHIESIIHHEQEDQPEVIKQDLAGTFALRGDEWVLRYKENEGTPDETRTAVKSTQDQITIIRHGAISYRQTYRPQETMTSMIHTPAGQTEMDVHTLYYLRERDEFHGLIRFSFHLTMGQEKLGNYQLTIRWTEGKFDEFA
ncbi:DUF1934 domain-containing protein [Thermoflavimicrobium daqui]|uniref:DUF1934 domain-containing protein n=1 Tax=Thermoflavimicrobium daqui TaxID=2137476 RepID=UPI00143CF628|nr:DUF1934 domain-containing protein [Thermoflavimicrobium daqui]